MRTSAYKRPQGKGSPAVSYYPKGMLVRGGGKGRDGGFARARGGGRRRGAKRPEKPGAGGCASGPRLQPVEKVQQKLGFFVYKR